MTEMASSKIKKRKKIISILFLGITLVDFIKIHYCIKIKLIFSKIFDDKLMFAFLLINKHAFGNFAFGKVISNKGI